MSPHWFLYLFKLLKITTKSLGRSSQKVWLISRARRKKQIKDLEMLESTEMVKNAYENYKYW